MPSELLVPRADVAHFERHGWLLTRALDSGGVRALQRWVDEVASWPDDEGDWLHYRERTDAGSALCRTENFVPFHDGLARLLTSEDARALWFHSRTPHRSGPNHSARPRRAICPTYNAASEGDLRAAYYEQKLRELAAAGDHADRVPVSLIGDFEGRPVE